MAPRRKRPSTPRGVTPPSAGLAGIPISSSSFQIDPELDEPLPSTLNTLESVTRDPGATTTTTTTTAAGNDTGAGGINANSSVLAGNDQLTAEESNRLTDFAQHVLGGKNDVNDVHPHSHSHSQSRGHSGAEADYGTFDATDGGLYAPAPEEGFTELLDKHHEQEREREREEQQVREGMVGRVNVGNAAGDGEYQSNGDAAIAHGSEQHHLGDGPPPPPPERTRRANKRRRDDEAGAEGSASASAAPGVDGADGGAVVLDPLRIKKDSHKEVERRRRENINVGIDEIAVLLPDGGGSSKEGKSVILKRAATYLGELTREVEHLRAEQGQVEQIRIEYQTQLENLQNELNEERSRSMRFERSWQQAEDRAAVSQFELARANAEVEKLRQ